MSFVCPSITQYSKQPLESQATEKDLTTTTTAGSRQPHPVARQHQQQEPPSVGLVEINSIVAGINFRRQNEVTMEPRAWTTPVTKDSTPFLDDNADSTSSSVTKAILIGGIILAFVYLFYFQQQPRREVPAATRAADLQEARRKHLEKLEQEQAKARAARAKNNSKRPAQEPKSTPKPQDKSNTVATPQASPSPTIEHEEDDEDDEMKLLRLKRPAADSPTQEGSKASAAAAAEARAAKRQTPPSNIAEMDVSKKEEKPTKSHK